MTLQQLKDSALKNNIAIRDARNSIDAASQQRKEALTKYFPNISANGAWFNANKHIIDKNIKPTDYIPTSVAMAMAQILPPEALIDLVNPINVSMVKDGIIAGVTATQPVFAGGKIINSNRLARVGVEASRLQLRLSENEVEQKTEQYYWQLVTLEEKMNTIKAVEELLADIHKDVDVAVRAGLVMRNDLLQVELRQNDIESQKLKLQNGISIVQRLLAQYCGLNSNIINVKKEDVVASAPVETGGNLMDLAEYQLLQKQVDAAHLKKLITVGQSMPTVAVGAGYNYYKINDMNRNFGMVFATVNVPISDWWGGSHAIKRKKIEQRKAEEELADKAELLNIRMEKAWNDVTEAYQQLTIAQRSIEQAEENLRLNRNYYKAGTSRMADLLEAQLLYQQARDRQTDAFADYQNKQLEYRIATGR
jgi:outer membrane protein TolC